jgi:hypothetical protein
MCDLVNCTSIQSPNSSNKFDKIYYLTCNIQHVKITEVFPNILHKFYNLTSLKFADNFNQDISSLSGSFPPKEVALLQNI